MTNDKLVAQSTVDDVDRWTRTTDGDKAVTILAVRTVGPTSQSSSALSGSRSGR
ncbi:hypothetical protein [Nocardia sp. NPDC004604]|uniref:hypothetical protein n=1 Tax=Nocardia sp. NPDC004604 TaxID=3157013 RepID=UPI0033A16527